MAQHVKESEMLVVKVDDPSTAEAQRRTNPRTRLAQRVTRRRRKAGGNLAIDAARAHGGLGVAAHFVENTGNLGLDARAVGRFQRAQQAAIGRVGLPEARECLRRSGCTKHTDVHGHIGRKEFSKRAAVHPGRL